MFQRPFANGEEVWTAVSYLRTFDLPIPQSVLDEILKNATYTKLYLKVVRKARWPEAEPQLKGLLNPDEWLYYCIQYGVPKEER